MVEVKRSLPPSFFPSLIIPPSHFLSFLLHIIFHSSSPFIIIPPSYSLSFIFPIPYLSSFPFHIIPPSHSLSFLSFLINPPSHSLPSPSFNSIVPFARVGLAGTPLVLLMGYFHCTVYCTVGWSREYSYTNSHHSLPTASSTWLKYCHKERRIQRSNPIVYRWGFVTNRGEYREVTLFYTLKVGHCHKQRRIQRSNPIIYRWGTVTNREVTLLYTGGALSQTEENTEK